MTRAYAEAPATHFRLKPETWAIIAEEYKNGASAKDLGAKWKVSPTSIYRYACRDGWTKKGMGDARARAHARMVEEEEAAGRSMSPVGSRALKTLFAPAPADQPEIGDPVALARAATLASGRAMRGRLWAEAKALAGLAESYGRLAKAASASGLTPETIELPLLYDILVTHRDAVDARFDLWGDGPETQHYELRRKYWERKGEIRRLVTQWKQTERARERRVRDMEQQIRDLGREPPPKPEF